MRIAFDIDGTLCSNTDGNYEDATPYEDMINLINDLYAAGHHIILHSARGMGMFNGDVRMAINKWYDLTQTQLDDWGVKYNEFYLGKIHADIYVDDKGYRIKDDGSSVKKLKGFIGA